MNYEVIKHPRKRCIGIKTRASNNEEGFSKIGALWQRFHLEGVLQKITGRLNDEIVAIYTNYENGISGEYDLIIGAVVSDDCVLEDGFVECFTDDCEYGVFDAKGEMPKAIIDCWQGIWKSDLERRFSTDFEVYKNSESGKVDCKIYIGMK